MTPPSKILLVPPLTRQRLRLGQVAQCYMLFNKLRPYAVVSAYFPKDLPTH